MITTKGLDLDKFKEITELASVLDKKSSIQSYAVELSRTCDHLLLSWATGCGKSLAALKIIKEKVDSGDTTPWFIVCAELNHINNWVSEIVKHKLGYLMNHIEIFCYASLHKYKNRKANLILDECHSASDLRVEHLCTIQADKVISLSATLNAERKGQLLKLFKIIRELPITVTDAINCGILPPPKIYVLFDKLDKTIANKVYVKKKGILRASKSVSVPKFTVPYSNYISWMSQNKDLISYELNILCTEQEYYDILTNDMNYYKKQYAVNRSPWHKNKMLNIGSERKTFIAESKTKILKKIDEALWTSELRYIGFTGSIEQCEEVAGVNHSIHSKIKKKEIEDRIKRFNSGSLRFLFAVQMLREGMNLENIDAGIITQLDSEDLSFVQMMGRVFRSTNPILFVIVKDGTQDVTYLKNCLDGIDDKYVTYAEYNEYNIDAIKSILCQEKTRKLEQEK